MNRASRLRTTKKKGKDRSPSKITEDTNLLLKPKNDDSSESSSIKDSGYEEPENAKIIKEKLTSKRSTGTKRDKGSSGTLAMTAKQETETLPRPVFNLNEINSIWGNCDEEDDDTEETEGKTSVESIRNDSDLEHPDNDPLGVTSPASARTTILG